MEAQVATPDSKLHSLKSLIKSYGSVLIAFSGGVDSAVVAKIASIELGGKALAVTADSPSMPPGELEATRRLAHEIGIRHRVVKTQELLNPDYVENGQNRCYFCKDELMRVLLEVKEEEGLEAIIDGTNSEDLHGPRPGFTAMKEHGSRSPLVELGIGKAEVRQLARMLELPVADKPSMACLSSRIQYGQPITMEEFRRIGEAESFIKSLVGVRQLRVRVHGSIARLEVGGNERMLFFDARILDQIAVQLRGLGFGYVTLDLEGYRSGSMNLAIVSTA